VIPADLSWPAASVYIALILAVGLVVAMLIWSVFRTGQTAIRVESRQNGPADRPRSVTVVSPSEDVHS
jgi:hypothetical protein